MWKFFKFIIHLIKAMAIILLLTMVLATTFFYLSGCKVPHFLLGHIEKRLASEDLLVRVEQATFGLRRGLRCHNVKILPKRVFNDPIARADQLTLLFILTPNPRHWLQEVNIHNFSMPTIPHGFATPETTEPHHLPTLAPFKLNIQQLDVLGMRVDKLSTMVNITPVHIAARDLHIKLPSNKEPLPVKGHVVFWPQTQRLQGELLGQAYPENLMPLFEEIGAHGAIRQINAFSKLAQPVQAHYTFHVETDTTDFDMQLGLELGACEYHTVPMKFARGTLGIYGTNTHTSVTVQNLSAETQDGSPLSGALAYCEAQESLAVQTRTTMMIEPLFDIINLLNEGELDFIQCDVPPSLEAQGDLALSLTKSTITNHLAGKIHLPAGRILNFAVKDLTSDFLLAHHRFTLPNFKATSPCSGQYSGQASFDFPNYEATSTVFKTELQLNAVALEQISAAFNVTNSRAGLVSGKLMLQGPTSGDTVAKLGGHGELQIADGVINQMRLFAGLTAYLSRNVPGISSLVNQSSGSLTFTMEDGILKTNNLRLEGDVFSLHGRGTYDINQDQLKFTIRANFFKSKSIVGKITHFVTFPFTRLLLEFKVFGSLEDPDWSYVTIIEKVTDTFTPESKKP